MNLFKVWYRDFVVWTHFKVESIVANLGEPILYLLAMGYGLGKYIGSINGIPYTEYVAPSLIVACVMNSVSFETTFSSYTRMTVQKTFDAIAVTPLSIQDIVLGEMLWATTKGCLAAFVMMVIFWISGLVHHPLSVFNLLTCFVTGIVFSAFGLLATSFATGYQFFSYYFILFISPMFFFAGTFFPMQGIGTWASILSWFLPLTHAVRISRELSTGQVTWGLLGSLLWLLIVGAVATKFAIKRMERKIII